MKAIVQRCHRAHVVVNGDTVGRIESGLVVFLGVMAQDDEQHGVKLAAKIAGLRIFSDSNGRFNDSIKDIAGSVLLIPNFTIAGDCRKGKRPSFSAAAAPEKARELYEGFAKLLRDAGLPVQTGIFGADMKVVVENDGPVSLIVDVI